MVSSEDFIGDERKGTKGFLFIDTEENPLRDLDQPSKHTLYSVLKFGER